MKWNTELYDQKHEFVSKYGKELFQLLAPKEGESILDIGCGTGDLTNEISKAGAQVIGIDNSEEMIRKARIKYPQLQFLIKSADDFSFNNKFDALFSNAALHWVLEKEKAISCIYDSLKTGGRFVAELGGKGNVNNIVSALRNSLRIHGAPDAANKEVWYFPTLSEYTSLLENQGFRVTWAAHFDRETLLNDKEGLRNWLIMFGKPFLEGLSSELIKQILVEVEQQARPTNFRKNKWFADYVRLRVCAIK